MRIGILTSIERRHRYFVEALRARFEVVAVGYEETGYSPADTTHYDLTPEEERIVLAHFTERARQEQAFLGDAPLLEDTPACRVRRLAPGKLNTDATPAFLRAAGVDMVVVYGTNLIKQPLLGGWPGRMLNLHLGLSPYYRGTATNFYPLLNDEPEYVGATIHLIDPGIDSGPIFRHARPEIVADDRPHTIGCKAILAGTGAMMDVLGALSAGRITPVAQWEVPNAKLYLRKHYHPRQVVQLACMVDDGLIPRYVARAPRAAPRVRLVQ
ncbi:MAG TPA: formyl transferase [Phycisphaerae bacterium]|nr:formyl transferase [Phycisphaerae bacterium]HNU44108.1 formyl transferase [Phycisphaerae bacterium]